MTSQSAYAFGTVRLFGQNSEHEKITRIALQCSQGRNAICIEADTLDQLAGKDGKFGAVGAPDPGPTALRFFAHCSGGDFLPGANYPRTVETAQNALKLCRKYMIAHMKQAVIDASNLLDENGQIEQTQSLPRSPCAFSGTIDMRAKCQVLRHFGATLHAAQDFYAHSNWVDLHDPGKPIDKDNPPGLNQRGRAPWLDLRLENPTFPPGLISGCGGIDAVTDGEGGCATTEGRQRVNHSMLNKDNGSISTDGIEGRTPRGRINENFRHAVQAAVEDTEDKWKTFQEALISTYGDEKGNRMICIIAMDDPLRSCQ